MDNENILETESPSSIETMMQNMNEALAYVKSISGEYSESIEGRSPEKQAWDTIKNAIKGVGQ